jgi:uncharacterized membrane protein YdjX (TVP38/TMEM64 family)
MQDAIDFLLQLNIETYVMVMIIFVLSIIHPMISQPWSLMTVTVASLWFGIPLALLMLWSGYILGMVFYYLIIRKIDRKYHFKKHSKFQKAIKWLDETPGYQHAISLGAPLVPTYLIKMMMPLSEKSFKSYMGVMIGAYVILTVSNVLLYYGIFVEAIFGERSWMTFLILFMFIVLMYGISYKNKQKVRG